MPERVTLEMSREAALVCEHAMELYARLKLGQFREITWHMMDLHSGADFDRELLHRDFANELLEMAAKHVYATYPPPKDDVFDRAWEVYTTLRYTRSWHDHPEGGDTVNFDRPMSESGDVMPKCEIREAD